MRPFLISLLLGCSPLVSQAQRSETSPARENAEVNKRVDAAIGRALKYLQGQQNSDGSWPSGRNSKPAVTSLAVMAFLAAGHVPGEGPYGKTVEKGVRAVLALQKTNGLIATDGAHEMYHHGICTLMLAEAVGMTQGPLASEVKRGLEKAVKIVLLAQRRGQHPNDPNRGGWRYRVAGDDADMSVTGWQLMALRAAKNVGCDVPAANIEQAVAYLKRSQDGNGGFRYEPYGGVTIPCTGTAILALIVCGREHQKSREAIKGGTFLLQHPPRWGQGPFFFYSLYYCTQATFQLGDNYWKSFRPELHRALLPNQSTSGRWDDPDGFGPSYATSMAVLALAVEYRFLPIYQRGEEPTIR